MSNNIKLKKELNKQKNILMNKILYLQKMNSDECKAEIEKLQKQITDLTNEYRKAIGKTVKGLSFTKQEEKEINKAKKVYAGSAKSKIIDTLTKEKYKEMREKGMTYTEMGKMFDTSIWNFRRVIIDLGWEGELRPYKKPGLSFSELEEQMSVEKYMEYKERGLRNENVCKLEGCTLSVLRYWIRRKRDEGKLQCSYINYNKTIH